MTAIRPRTSGAPSPIADGTHDDSGLPPSIPFAAGGGQTELDDAAFLQIDRVDLGAGAPTWLVAAARLIRPLSVGALMAIPTLGAATIGLVAMFDRTRAMAMADASVAFLAGLPTDIVLLIGTLGTGYGFARSIEKLRGKNR